jgi:Mg-chelatase subunit ChlD
MNNLGITALRTQAQKRIATRTRHPKLYSNRIALMLDVSPSMYGAKIEALREAVTGFIDSCDFSNTAIAIHTFPVSICLALTNVKLMLYTSVQRLDIHEGGTPMDLAMEAVFDSGVARAIIVSDGQADSQRIALAHAERYRISGIPVDCVHIGNETEGEELLRTIADITNGRYIKFTNIQAFSNSFKFLTPKLYSQLASGNVSALQLGAKEMK